MPPGVLQEVQAVVLAGGASVAVPHSLSDGVVRVQPNIVQPDRDTSIAVASADDSEVVYNNAGDEATSANFLVQFDHTIQQATPTGVPLQFYYQGGSASASGAAAGDESNLWYPPATADALDDEFDVDTLDPDWSVDGGLSATPIDNYDAGFVAGQIRSALNSQGRPSWWLLQAPGNNAFLSLTKNVADIDPLLLYARLKSNYALNIGAADTENGYIALRFRVDSSNQIRINVQYTAVGTNLVRFDRFNLGGYSIINDSSNMFQSQYPVSYIALHRIGTTYHGWFASEDGSWFYMGGSTMHAGFVPTEIGYLIGGSNVSTGFLPGPPVVGTDFFRALRVSSLNI